MSFRVAGKVTTVKSFIDGLIKKDVVSDMFLVEADCEGDDDWDEFCDEVFEPCSDTIRRF